MDRLYDVTIHVQFDTHENAIFGLNKIEERLGKEKRGGLTHDNLLALTGAQSIRTGEVNELAETQPPPSMAAQLLAEFPWLDDPDADVNGADVIDSLSEWFGRVK